MPLPPGIPADRLQRLDELTLKQLDAWSQAERDYLGTCKRLDDAIGAESNILHRQTLRLAHDDPAHWFVSDSTAAKALPVPTAIFGLVHSDLRPFFEEPPPRMLAILGQIQENALFLIEQRRFLPLTAQAVRLFVEAAECIRALILRGRDEAGVREAAEGGDTRPCGH